MGTWLYEVSEFPPASSTPQPILPVSYNLALSLPSAFTG
jgi:hypothetical protein